MSIIVKLTPHRAAARMARMLAICLTAAMLGACVATAYPGAAATDTQDTESLQQKLAGDLPLPRDAVIDQKDSLILGVGSSWTGRIVMSSAGDVKALFTFFRDQMPAAGWQTVASVLARNSILTFVKADRVATIELGEGMIGSNRVTITVGGVNRAATPAAAPSR